MLLFNFGLQHRKKIACCNPSLKEARESPYRKWKYRHAVSACILHSLRYCFRNFPDFFQQVMKKTPIIFTPFGGIITKVGLNKLTGLKVKVYLKKLNKLVQQISMQIPLPIRFFCSHCINKHRFIIGFLGGGKQILQVFAFPF